MRKRKTLEEKVGHLCNHYDPILFRVIGGNWYGFIQQNDRSIAIKAVELKLMDFSPDEGTWLTFPEPRYETQSGACYGLLCFLDEYDEEE
jgi:hypothetical protein